GSFTPATVAHELNHAMQAAMDCSEVITYWENTAVYMEVATFPHLAMQALWSFYSFQALPWRSLDYFEYGQGYQYGGSLWNFFLVDGYDAPDTGPVMLRQIWEASMQEGESNSVTYFDGIAQVLSERTAEASPLEAAFVDFCEARYFVGERDDGAHIDGARDWWFGELIITDRHTVFDLPIERGAPVDARRPAPFGSNHIQLDLPQGYSAPIRIRFRGELMNRWAARVLLLSSGPVEAVDLEVDSETGMGEAVVPTEGRTALLLVVANLGPAGFQPGVGRRDGGVYTYDLLPELPPPVIVGADPPTLDAGQQGVLLRLLGEGFVLGQDFRVAFEDPTIQVDSVIAVSSDEVVLRLTIPAMTNLGPKSVLVTNHGGQSARGVDVVTILAPPTRETEGCACQAPEGQDPAGATPVVLACFLAFALGRRLRGRRR
ncbi:MAG: hypothetical protein RBU30_21235, partial [Polyangia bacterium]|nr:hypothetical protein [Polyangia bacterium]